MSITVNQIVLHQLVQKNVDRTVHKMESVLRDELPLHQK